MKVIIASVDFDTIDTKFITWLYKLPKEKRYKEIRMEDLGKKYKMGYSKIEPVDYGSGFYIENDSDPLFVEFRSKWPNAKYRIEE